MRSYRDTFSQITLDQLMLLVQEKKDHGSRFVDIHVNTLTEGFELIYAFTDDDMVCDNYLVNISADTKVPSISAVFLCAFFFENEAHDLFGIDIEGIAIDFKGNFYQTAIKYPMAHETTPEDMYSVNDRVDSHEPLAKDTGVVANSEVLPENASDNREEAVDGD